jgi:site-specific DNA recombinase
MKNTSKIKKAVIMCRVSSDEQALGYSLGIQEEALRKYCQLHNIEIVYVIREDHSAKNFDRPEFQKFLKLIQSNKEGINTLLFVSWDRFSRNVTDAFIMIRKLNQAGIEPHATEQPLDLSVPENLTILAIYLTLPEVDNRRRSIKIRGGVRAALKAGRWPRLAPIGYKNARDENNKPIIVPSKDAIHIHYLYKQVANGISQIEVREALKKKGFKLDKSVASKMLRNPVYAGYIEVPKEEDEPYVIIKGLHEGLVDQKLFTKVQEVLTEKKKLRSRPNSNRKREELALRGILSCSKCGHHMTGSSSKGKMGVKYVYYHCNNCHADRIPANYVNDTMLDILGSLRFNKTAENLFQEILKNKLKVRSSEKGVSPLEIEKKLVDVKKKLINVQDLVASERISPEDFSEMKARYQAEKTKLEKQLVPVSEMDSEEKNKIREALNKITKLQQLYIDGDVSQKQHIVSSTFPEKISFSDGKCRTLRLNEVVRLALNADKGFRGNEKRQIHDKLDLSLWVDPQRIELWSKQALNALSTCVADY